MVSAWLLSLHLEMVPMPHSCWHGGDSPWERWRLGVWDLGEVRAGCAPVLDADQ